MIVGGEKKREKRDSTWMICGWDEEENGRWSDPINRTTSNATSLLFLLS